MNHSCFKLFIDFHDRRDARFEIDNSSRFSSAYPCELVGVGVEVDVLEVTDDKSEDENARWDEIVMEMIVAATVELGRKVLGRDERISTKSLTCAWMWIISHSSCTFIISFTYSLFCPHIHHLYCLAKHYAFDTVMLVNTLGTLPDRP
jgi:hypothetical protein